MGITQEGGLHRCGAMRKDAEAMAGGVAGQIDQQIDLLIADAMLEGLVIELARLDPGVGSAAGSRRVFVMHGAGVEHRDRELVAVEPLQQGQHEQVDGVLAVKITGDQAKAQGPIDIAVVGEGGLRAASMGWQRVRCSWAICSGLRSST